MFRLRDAVAAVALVTSGVGCTFCDECANFPVPGGYAAMPGTYTGGPIREAAGFNVAPPASPSAVPETSPDFGPASGNASEESAPTPPPPPPAENAAPPFSPSATTPPPLPDLPQVP